LEKFALYIGDFQCSEFTRTLSQIPRFQISLWILTGGFIKPVITSKCMTVHSIFCLPVALIF
jgi:hypothetical protein